MNSRLKAEAAAKAYLSMRKFKVIEQNWRHTGYVIDIIAEKEARIFFVEVNYIHDDAENSRLEPLSKSKLERTKRAAEGWVKETKWLGTYYMARIDIAGPTFAVLSFTDNIN